MRLPVCLLLVLGLSVLPASATPILLLDPSTGTFAVNATFSVDVKIQGVTGDSGAGELWTDLWAYQFSLGFNPSVLEATGITDGGFLAAGGTGNFIPGTIDNTAGNISFTGDALNGFDPGVTGAGVLATIFFKAIGPGVSSPVNLSDVILLSFNFDDFTGDTTIQSAAFTVEQEEPPPTTAVPEPASLFLLGSGLVGLAYRRKRRSAQK